MTHLSNRMDLYKSKLETRVVKSDFAVSKLELIKLFKFKFDAHINQQLALWVAMGWPGKVVSRLQVYIPLYFFCGKLSQTHLFVLLLS